MLRTSTIWIAFGVYLIFLLSIALWENHREKKKSARGFLTAGGSIAWPFLVMTYLASLMSTWVFFRRPGRLLPRRSGLLAQRNELYRAVSGHRALYYE